MASLREIETFLFAILNLCIFQFMASLGEIKINRIDSYKPQEKEPGRFIVSLSKNYISVSSA